MYPLSISFRSTPYKFMPTIYDFVAVSVSTLYICSSFAFVFLLLGNIIKSSFLFNSPDNTIPYATIPIPIILCTFKTEILKGMYYSMA